MTVLFSMSAEELSYFQELSGINLYLLHNGTQIEFVDSQKDIWEFMRVLARRHHAPEDYVLSFNPATGAVIAVGRSIE